MKKLLAIVLTLLFVMSSFVSCIDTGDADDSVTTGDEAQTDNGSEAIVLCDSNNEYYSLIRPEMATSEMMSCMYSIRDGIDEISNGLTLTPSTDWVKPGTDVSGNKELLLGYTCRDESKSVMQEIGYDDFAIVTRGNKIVIAAHKLNRLVEAVKYFCENLIKAETSENDIVTVTFLGDYHMKSSESYIINAENPLENYKIICDMSNTVCASAASKLASEIKSVYKITLTVSDDNKAETDCEIVVGNADRDACKQYFEGNNAVGEFEYVIGTYQKKVVIGGVNDSMTDIAVENFCNNNIDSHYSYTANFAEGCQKYLGNTDFKDSATLAVGADIRVMSFNLLCELWNAQTPVAGRDETIVSAIKYYSPDVIGIQEVSDDWHDSLNRLFGSTYKITDATNGKGKTNFSTLAYNTTKVSLIEHGVKIYSKGNDVRLRLVTWGLFERKADKTRFVAMTTHWDLTSSPDTRTVQSNELATFAKELENKYNCPVILTGDYNTKESESQLKNLISKTGYSSAKYSAIVKNRACKTTHNLGKNVSTTPADCIDHILGSSKVKFLYFNVLVDKCIIDSSDHCPIYADIKLN